MGLNEDEIDDALDYYLKSDLEDNNLDLLQKHPYYYLGLFKLRIGKTRIC